MRIRINIDEHRYFAITIPNWIAFGPLGALALARSKSISYRQSAEMMKKLKRARHVLNGQPLVSVSKNGKEEVHITL